MKRELKKEDFFSPDGKIEYCYDRFRNKHEVGPSFKDIPMATKCISCPICRACKNQGYNENRKTIYCKSFGKIPEELGMGRMFKCEHYIPDEESYDYELVKKLMEEHKGIGAFTEGTSLDEIEKAREVGKRPYQKAFLAIGAGIIAVLVTGTMMWIFG